MIKKHTTKNANQNRKKIEEIYIFSSSNFIKFLCKFSVISFISSSFFFSFCAYGIVELTGNKVSKPKHVLLVAYFFEIF